MQAFWSLYVASFPCNQVRGTAVGEALRRRYESRGRYYHGAAHILAMLRLCRRHQARLTQPLSVQTAIWFHDAIYVSRRRDNEERSAALALRVTAQLGRPDPDAATMILATRRHSLEDVPPRLHADTAWLLDFDLAILAAPRAAYDAYAQAIRREYYWVSARKYAEGRSAVLGGFLQRPTLYFNPELRERWEAQARANLAREIQRHAS